MKKYTTISACLYACLLTQNSLADNKKEMKISSPDNFLSNINSCIICMIKKVKVVF